MIITGGSLQRVKLDLKKSRGRGAWYPPWSMVTWHGGTSSVIQVEVDQKLSQNYMRTVGCHQHEDRTEFEDKDSKLDFIKSLGMETRLGRKSGVGPGRVVAIRRMRKCGFWITTKHNFASRPSNKKAVLMKYNHVFTSLGGFFLLSLIIYITGSQACPGEEKRTYPTSLLLHSRAAAHK